MRGPPNKRCVVEEEPHFFCLCAISPIYCCHHVVEVSYVKYSAWRLYFMCVQMLWSGLSGNSASLCERMLGAASFRGFLPASLQLHWPSTALPVSCRRRRGKSQSRKQTRTRGRRRSHRFFDGVAKRRQRKGCLSVWADLFMSTWGCVWVFNVVFSLEPSTPVCCGELRRWSHGSYTLLHDGDAVHAEFGLDLVLPFGCTGPHTHTHTHGQNCYGLLRIFLSFFHRLAVRVWRLHMLRC